MDVKVFCDLRCGPDILDGFDSDSGLKFRIVSSSFGFCFLGSGLVLLPALTIKITA